MAGRVPAALRHRLGDDATIGLVELLDSERKDWSDQVLSVAADRFERRLSEELSILRVEVRTALHDGLTQARQEIAQTRQELAQTRQEPTHEMYSGLDSVRGDIVSVRAEIGSVRSEVGSVRAEVAASRVEALRWSFVFWIGQVAAMAGMLSFVLRR